MRGLRRGADIPFFAAFIALSGSYALLIVGMLAADLSFASVSDLSKAFQSREIRYSIVLSLVSCTASALLSMLAAVPAGYLLSRFQFRGKSLAEGLFDIPIALPPLVVGISLLILFQTPPGDFLEKIAAGAARYTGFNALMRWIGAPEVKGIGYETPAVVLAQFTVAAAFAVRAMRVSFDQIDPRQEQVALTLGCGRGQAFFSRRASAGAPRTARRLHARMGALHGRVRTGAGLRQRDPNEDGGSADNRIYRIERRQLGSGRLRFVHHDRRRVFGAVARPRDWTDA